MITSAGVGSAINIIKAFSKQNEISIHVIAVDQDPLSAGLFMADQSFVSPPVDDSKCYIDFLLSISKKFHVDALFPCHSSEISLIADNQDLLKNNGIQTLISTSEVINLCNDKVRMKKRVNALGIKTPKTLHNPVCSDIPCFTKLNSSSSSKGAQLIDNEHLSAHFRKDKIQRIYETYIEGEEYTVDILCDRNSRVLTACPRHRISTKAGQSVKGRSQINPNV